MLAFDSMVLQGLYFHQPVQMSDNQLRSVNILFGSALLYIQSYYGAGVYHTIISRSRLNFKSFISQLVARILNLVAHSKLVTCSSFFCISLLVPRSS